MKKFGKKMLLVGIILGGFFYAGCEVGDGPMGDRAGFTAPPWDVMNQLVSQTASEAVSGDIVGVSGFCTVKPTSGGVDSDPNATTVTVARFGSSAESIEYQYDPISGKVNYNAKFKVAGIPGAKMTLEVYCNRDDQFSSLTTNVGVLAAGLRLESIPASVVVGASVPLKASLASAATDPLNISFAAVAAAKGSAAMAKTNCTIPVGKTSCSTSMTATSAGNFSLSAAVINYAPASAKLTVLPVPPTSITISPTTATLARGGSTSFTAVLSGANSKTSSQNLTLTDAKSPGGWYKYYTKLV